MTLDMTEGQANRSRHTAEMLNDALDYHGIDGVVSHDSGKIVLRLENVDADALTQALRGRNHRSKEE